MREVHFRQLVEMLYHHGLSTGLAYETIHLRMSDFAVYHYLRMRRIGIKCLFYALLQTERRQGMWRLLSRYCYAAQFRMSPAARHGHEATPSHHGGAQTARE